MIVNSPMGNYRRSCLVTGISILAVVLIVMAVAAGIIWYFKFRPQPPVGIGVTNESNELIGLSNGAYAFDTTATTPTTPGRSDVALKQQASDQFKNGHVSDAQSLWAQAIAKDPSDGEAHIYYDDVQSCASSTPHVTLVVATMLTGTGSSAPGKIGTGRDDLQGAYIAQKEYNEGNKLGRAQLCLLIANAGTGTGQSGYTTNVAQQIVQAAQKDKTIVGVMGWPYSGYTLAAVSILAAAGIPMVSQAASSDSLTGKSPYFFRVVPSNKSQAVAGANYAVQQFHSTSAAIFVDPKNSYSTTLANDFRDAFVAEPEHPQVVVTENYTVGDKESIDARLQDAQKTNPDLIYFAGYADDMAVLLTDLPMAQSNLQVLGGDALYDVHAYRNPQQNFQRLRFTAFAYPDEWSGRQNPPIFFNEYSSTFDPNGTHVGSYGYSRPDSEAMLSYDAVSTLAEGCSNALAGKTSMTPSQLKQSLSNLSGSEGAFQGVTGQISLGSNGDPINKTVVILTVDQSGHIQLATDNPIQGCFLVGQCSNP